jgi:hypothetical protein
LQKVDARSLDALAEDIKCEVRSARSLGMTPILVTHPDRFGNTVHQDDQDRLVAWRMQYPVLMEAGFRDLESRANNVIRTTALAEGVVVVDAAEQMSGHGDWFADHAHLTNEGSATMGKILASAVLSAYAAHPLVTGAPAGAGRSGLPSTPEVQGISR